MSNRRQRVVFMVWSWLALPWGLVGLALAFRFHLWAGVALVILTGIWFSDMGATTCSRCGLYGTGRCGVQSWLVPLLWRKKSARSVSRLRLRLHYYFDLVMLALGVAVYSTCPVLLPFCLAWVAVGWWLIYRPGKFHGLLPLLAEPKTSRRVSLPLVPEKQ
jgi:hypothetical protein